MMKNKAHDGKAVGFPIFFYLNRRRASQTGGGGGIRHWPHFPAGLQRISGKSAAIGFDRNRSGKRNVSTQ